MAPPFTPSYRDGQSAAHLITELASGQPYGYLLEFGEIAECLGIDPAERTRIRSAMARAKPRLLREHLRAVEAVPDQGYRIIEPGQHARLAGKHQRKSDRQIIKAISLIKHADEDGMSDAERDRHHRVGMALQLLHERQLDTERRVGRLEALMLGKGAPKVVPGYVIPPRSIESPPADH